MRHRVSFLFIFSLFFIQTCVWSSHDFFIPKEGGVVYPQGFLKGVASCTYQNSGHHYWESLGYRPQSNWTWFENEFRAHFVIDRERAGGASALFTPASPIDRGEKVGLSADTWHHMFDDIQLIKQLGCNAYRFELPWTDLNPQEGVWNEEAFAVFDRYIDALRENGIEPIITLYHWVHPRWFHDRNAWEKEENIRYFVEYAQEAFKRFGHKVKYWCTINEPTVISVGGYILGTHAPGKKDHASMLRPFCSATMLSLIPHNYDLAGTVLGNLFKAHIEVYGAIKALPHGDQAQVSIIHQAAYFKPLEQSGFSSMLNPISRMLAHYFNTYFAHAVFMKFFKTGQFSYDLPGGTTITFVDERAPQTLDFIALNFYADMFFGPGPACPKGDTPTDMTMWAMRPQSIYAAIQEMATLNVPIIITENGICDAKDDRRGAWIVGYSNAIKQALDDGYDVRGYCYWSFLDNYEWNMGHNKKFGLYAVDTLSDDPAQKARILRKGSELYRDYVHVEGLA
jgi:beta-glucosidase